MCIIAVVLRSCFVVAIALLLAAPAGAQQWDQPWADPLDRPGRVDISVSTGFLVPTDWSDLVLLGTISPAFGILEQVLVQDVRLESDVKFAGSATYWRGRYGIRTDVGHSRSSLTIGGAPLGIAGEPVDVRTWLYGVRGAVGLVEYSPRRWIWPYGFVGFGGITYNLAQPVSPPLLTVIELGGPVAGQADLIVVDRGREFLLQINELNVETEFAFSFGAGVDLRIPTGPAGIGLRLEVADHITRSPLRLQVRELGAPAHEMVTFGPVHHLRASAGLVVRFGR